MLLFDLLLGLSHKTLEAILKRTVGLVAWEKEKEKRKGKKRKGKKRIRKKN